jgi:hypothetical protein
MKKKVNGISVDCSPADIAQREIDEAAHVVELAKWQADQYKRDRVAAYREMFGGGVEEQLDFIYHNTLTAWKAKIAEVKALYPKPGA